MSKKATTSSKSSPTWQRYLLTGAAIGLYFGYFFRPVREPSLLLAMALAAVIAVVLLLLTLFKKEERPSMATLWQQMALNFVKYGLILAVFEARHGAYDWGGRAAVMVMTTAFGMLCGAWLAYEQTAKSTPSTKRAP